MLSFVERYSSHFLLVIVLSLTAYCGGYYRGSDIATTACQLAYEKKENEHNDAIDKARQKAKASDKKALEEKERADKLAREVWRRNRDAAASLPNRNCGLSADEWLLLNKQYKGE